MEKLFIQCTYTNETEGYLLSEPEIMETDCQNLSDLYKEVKRCFKGRVTKMFMEYKDGSSVQVGYIVTRKIRYEDTKEFYKQSIWIELLKQVQVVETVTKYTNFNAVIK